MEVISRILSSMSAAWVSWVMLVMLVLMAFNRFFVTDMAVILRGLFSRSERLYLDSTWQGRAPPFGIPCSEAVSRPQGFVLTVARYWKYNIIQH